MEPRDARAQATSASQSFLKRLADLARAQREAFAEAMRRVDEKRAKSVRAGIGSREKP